MDVKITEVSLSFQVVRPPGTHVGKDMPYLVNTIGDDIERVIPNEPVRSLPWWMDDPQPGTARFVYSSSLQDVECNYNGSRLTLQGIKYKHIDQFNEHIDGILNALNTEPAGPPVTRYKAVAKLKICAPWDPDALADIITNDPEMAQVIALCERTSTLGDRRLFSVVVGDLCRAAITHKDNVAFAMMSKLPDEESSVGAANVLLKLFKTYERMSHVVDYDVHTPHAVSGIGALRERLPELFVNNYTRECPVLPIMLSSEEAERQRHDRRVILYPLNNGRYYTAPEGYFVGLKRNRLANKERFPCLVTCYLQDHMLREGSETHIYYNNKSSKDNSGKKRPLPKSIQDPSYHRKRSLSFTSAVESATGVKVGSFKWRPYLVKQEMWDKSDDEIMTAVKNGPGSLVYRYFEEVVGVSIHVVVIKDGNFEPLVPRHKGHYVWAPPYPLHVVIFETYKTTYGTHSCSYDYLARKDVALFDDADPVVSYLTTQKGKDSVAPPQIPDGVREQTLDRNGKCAAVTMEDGEHVATYSRPIDVPVTPEPACFLDFHVRKMNDAKREMGLFPVDLSKRSNNDVLYFPNDASFRYYVGESEGNGAEGFF